MELIAAIATAEGTGGVAIVRVSGEGALSLARKMFSRRGEYQPNMLYPGTIEGEGFSDYGMCVYFRAPHSFTGEDTVEFHCHGGREIARGILRRALSLGARLAGRGEFTRRAFLNGKLSLAAAEGLADMIGAASLAEVRAGYALYGEKLTEEGRSLQQALKRCIASVDADVDYPEEDLNPASRAEILRELCSVRTALTALLARYPAGRKVKRGVNVALCGIPNAGKSTLFNALLGSDRAIVSAEAGTTRDVVEGEFAIEGVLFRLFDTAGLREGESEVEREGIRRAERVIQSADVIVWLKEGELPAFPQGVPVITVGAKGDLGEKQGCDVVLSARTGEGVEQLKALLYERGYGRESGAEYLLEERHFRAAQEALAAVEAGIAAAEGGLPPELYAEDILRAWRALGEISGETATEAVITEIFEKFCVGK